MGTNQHQSAAIAASSIRNEGSARSWVGRSVRSWLGLLVVAAVPCVSFANVEGGPVADLPAFVFEPLYADNQGSVYGVYEARQADLVLVKGGFDSGFRRGMVCEVAKNAGQVGEVVLVDVRNNCSAALILDLEPENVIEPDQSVRIKTVNF